MITAKQVYTPLITSMLDFKAPELIAIGLSLGMEFSTATSDFDEVDVNYKEQGVINICRWEGGDWHVVTNVSLPRVIAYVFLYLQDREKARKAFNVSGVRCPEFVTFMENENEK